MSTPLGSGAGPATTTDYQQGQRIGPDELRTMFLFESLTREQLDWVAERSAVELFPAGRHRSTPRASPPRASTCCSTARSA